MTVDNNGILIPNSENDIPITMSQVVRHLALKFAHDGLHPFDINDGRCGEFAHDALEYMDDLRLLTKISLSHDDIFYLTTQVADGEYTDLPNHVWISCHDYFFDAEQPDPVKDWRMLPIFMRYLYKPEDIDNLVAAAEVVNTLIADDPLYEQL